ncbi:sushi domain-containing protein 1 isoform X3 [Antennarius striatus]|uniref:sushi domain-containing protein 1 isoform X3 n=1 Tax=Antennarius striatus TaxID=241820 RepID=UPI0035AE0279
MRDEKSRTTIRVLILCVFADVQGEVLTLDVCATCHANATCDDKLDGSGKVCNCKYGFVGNGRILCQDKDECQIESSNICGQHTVCHNTYGSYYCTCLSGYKPSNNLAVFIPNDGTHCQDINECRVADVCGDGGQCRNLNGSFDCRCQLGYRVHNGAVPFNPYRDHAFCKEVDCGRPASREDRMLLSVTGTTYGSVAMFSCSESFVLRNGDNISVCGADGWWTEPTMVCEEVDCGSPPAIPHSQMLWNKSSRMGAEVFYHCNSGYRNIGKGNVSVCNSAGQWQRPSVSCREILCGSPPIVESTEQVWNRQSTPGSTVLYSCKKGFYDKGGLDLSICTENGHWTPPTLSCQEILCEEPPKLPHTVQVWNGSSSPGSTVTYICKIGFYHSEGTNTSLCTASGQWTKLTITCKEVDCGVPPLIPHSVMLWDNVSTVGSQVVYQCNTGYQSAGEGNISLCTTTGKWDAASLVCQEISCGPPLNLPHTNLLWDGTSRLGSVVLYECVAGFYQESENNMSTCLLSGQWGEVSVKCKANCGPFPFPANSEVVWSNTSVVIHRCVDGYRNWRGSNISVCGSSGLWRKATLKCIETKPPISRLFVFNDKCLQWKAEKNEEDTEVYKVTYTGSRDYQRSFHDKRKRFLSSKADLLELCLNLLPVTNYSISVTAMSAQFTATVTANTTLPVPPAPAVYYREYETPLPTLKLRRSPNTLDPISLYQVFVLPVEGIVMFDCSSPASSDPPSRTKSSLEYITAQIDVKHIKTEMNFTIGDGMYYGGFLNAPLENGRDYYIILRAVSQWKTALKSSCVLWAKVRGFSRRHDIPHY